MAFMLKSMNKYISAAALSAVNVGPRINRGEK